MGKERTEREWLKTLFKKKKNNKKYRWPLHYMLLLGCAGILLMVLGSLFSPNEKEQELSVPPTEELDDEPAFGSKVTEKTDPMSDYELRYENELQEVLEQIVGLSDVSVMINLAETERHMYEKDSNVKEQQTNETDREGGTRQVEDFSRDEQLVIVRQGDKEEPILTYKEKPRIRGVLVVAKGVENAEIKGWVVEAVSRVLDVPSHRVSVLPKKKLKEES